jgi:hypothetical protein
MTTQEELRYMGLLINSFLESKTKLFKNYRQNATALLGPRPPHFGGFEITINW